MIVSASKYRALERRLELVLDAYQTLDRSNDRLLAKWNKLARRINAKGGEDFLENATLGASPAFGPEDLNRLIRLCHPDKHSGSAMATEMTQKLLAMRDKAPKP